MSRTSLLVLTVAATICCSASRAADDPGMGKDLSATIALQGMPCDKVVDAKRNGDSDYTATCKDGNHYHVFVNPQGRVVVQKL
jgi:hypothetical protein